MARNRSNGMEPTDLGAILEETLVLLERELHKYRIRVDKRIGNVPAAMAIGNQIQQVLLNLLINSRQAMPRGGILTIKLEHDLENDMIDLTVRDNGVGIPPDKLQQVFEPFFSTKAGPDETGKGGTGLGLSSCRAIVEAHRGRIRVESTVGKGTSFTIKLPAVPKRVEPSALPRLATSPTSPTAPTHSA
jgi:signal transduction histidine kinase